MFQQCLLPMATVCHGSTQETPLENACDFAKASIKFASSSARQDDCITARRSARLGDFASCPLPSHECPEGNFKVLGGADIVFLRARDVSMIPWVPSFSLLPWVPKKHLGPSCLNQSSQPRAHKDFAKCSGTGLRKKKLQTVFRKINGILKWSRVVSGALVTNG